jgi:hypothetical protein
VTRVAQSACLHDVDDTRVVELPIELEIVSPPVHSVFNYRASNCTEHLPLENEQLVLFLSGQHPGLAAIQQYRAYQGLVDGFFVERERCLDCRCLQSLEIRLCISRLTSLFGVTRDPRYTNSLTTSNVLSPNTTLCLTSRINRSVPAAIVYFVLLSLIFSPTLFASFSNAR